MNSYIIATPNGLRRWQADDEDHAREQHADAFPVNYNAVPDWFRPNSDGVMVIEDGPTWTATSAAEIECDDRIILCVPEPVRFCSHAEHGFDGLPWPLPADCWLWQSGDTWIAQVAAFNRNTWWDGADEADLEARPEPWCLPIDQLPTTGDVKWVDADGTDHGLPANLLSWPRATTSTWKATSTPTRSTGSATNLYEYEYAVVESVERETETCVLVHFENADSVGFPPDHQVKLASD